MYDVTRVERFLCDALRMTLLGPCLRIWSHTSCRPLDASLHEADGGIRRRPSNFHSSISQPHLGVKGSLCMALGPGLVWRSIRRSVVSADKVIARLEAPHGSLHSDETTIDRVDWPILCRSAGSFRIHREGALAVCATNSGHHACSSLSRWGRHMPQNSLGRNCRRSVCVRQVSSFLGLSHQFFVEPLQTLIVTWVFVIMIRSRSWPRSRILIHLAAAIILAGLVKTTTLTYCLVPLLFVVVVLLRRTDAIDFRQELQLWSSRVLLLISFVFGGLGLLWYKL